jgi:hypothetical protein
MTVNIKEVLEAVDFKEIELWDAIEDDQRKDIKNAFFLLNRYVSNVTGKPSDIQEHFIFTVNEYFNKHWNTLQKHPKLLWQLLCLCSYNGKSKYFHEWIGFKKKGTTSNKKANFLAEIYPNMKLDEIELLAKLSSENELIALAISHGMEDREVKKKLK